MIQLIIYDDLKIITPEETSFGGFPVREIDRAFEWPQCMTCGSELQYLGKVVTDIGIEMIFMCAHDPGMCYEWDANSGGNKVIIINGGNVESFKLNEIAVRDIEYGVKMVESFDEDYDTARENWQGKRREVLGKYYGQPSWIQSDETPECDCCNMPMRFVAQLEEGPDHRTAMNFGGGVAYLFDCKEGRTAKFLWQC